MSHCTQANDLDLGHLAGGSGRLFLPAEARSMHMYVCGGTGVGKSKFLESLIRQDILNWRDSHCGMLLLDPHGSLYEKRQTLAEAVALLDDPFIRRGITANLKDRMSRRDWKVAAEMRPKEFETQVGSTVNRLQRFLRNEYLKVIFGQAHVSLDFGEA